MRSVSEFCIFVLATAFATQAQTSLGTAFTYQGRLENAGSPAGGVHDLRFRLYDALSGGAQVGASVCIDNVNITDGLFTVSLDFGAQFNGEQRFLEIDVRSESGSDCANPGGFTSLAPRQALSATPYALFARNVPIPLTLTGTSNNWLVKAENATTAAGASSINATSTGLTGNTYGVFAVANSNAGVGVFGRAAAGSGATSGVYGQNFSTTGHGVFGAATAASGINYGVYGRTSSASGHGVFGEATATSGTTYGGRFESASAEGYGVFGLASAASGATRGGWFESESPDGIGVFGFAAFGAWGQSGSTTGRGVTGFATTSTGVNTGVWGQTSSSSGRGVYGNATNTTGGVTYGVYGRTVSGAGRGVYGNNDSTTGTAVGVAGQSASIDGRGVYGLATNGSGETCGVYGETVSTSGFGVFGFAATISGNTSGVYGENRSVSGAGVDGYSRSDTGFSYGGRFVNESENGRAVYGVAYDASTTCYGVRGQSTNGYGVYSVGDMAATGTKPFRIDHPDDPANKYLLHYSAECPEVINFYRGTVLLDGAGEAVVELPHYFGKINKTPSYVLTAVGAPMPALHIAAEIDEIALNAGARAEPGESAPACAFRIAGGAPGGKVSWRVEAVRNDRWVQHRHAPVEVEKQNLERGTYQHPELYGQPPERAMDFIVERDRRLPTGDFDSSPR